MSRYKVAYQLEPDETSCEYVDADNIEAAKAAFDELFHATIPESAIDLVWEGDTEPEDRRLRRLGAERLPGMGE